MKKGARKKVDIVTRIALLLVVFSLISAYASTAAAQKIRLLQTTGPTTWASYAQGVAFTDLINRKSNLNITLSSRAPLVAIEALAKGQCSLTGPFGSPAFFAYHGWEEWADKGPRNNLRWVATTILIWQGFLGPASSGIKTIPDFKGKRISRFTVHTNALGDAIMEVYGLDPMKDCKNVMVPDSGDAFSEMKLGRIDILFSALMGAKILDLKETVGKLVVPPIEPDKLKEAKKKYPSAMITCTPAYATPKTTPQLDLEEGERIPVIGKPMGIATRSDVPDEIIYTYVKTALDNYKEAQTLHKNLMNFTPEFALAMIGDMPYHEGAIKAYKEYGVWTKELEEAQRSFFK